jgi:hypothetical protein
MAADDGGERYQRQSGDADDESDDGGDGEARRGRTSHGRGRYHARAVAQ